MFTRPSRMQMTPIRRCPSAEQVVGDTANRGRVVDAHQVGAGDAGLIADHRRNRPGQRGREMRVVVGHRVHDEPVDRGAGHRQHILGVRSRGHQQQPDPGLVALQGEPLQERDGPRVPERVRHLLGEQQPDRAGLARPQRAGHRVGARVAHPPRRFHHPRPQLRRQLVGTVVGVGHRGPGDAQLGRERRQRCRRSRPWWAIHHPCTVSGGLG